MEPIKRLVTQGVVFVLLFWAIGRLLNEPMLQLQEAALIFVIYIFATAVVERFFDRKKDG